MGNVQLRKTEKRELSFHTVLLKHLNSVKDKPPEPPKENVFLKPLPEKENFFLQPPEIKIPFYRRTYNYLFHYEKLPKKPEAEKWWTVMYYGPRGSGKTLHQAKECLKIFEWLTWLYKTRPKLKRAIVYSVQRFSKEIEQKYSAYTYPYLKEEKDADGKPIVVTDFERPVLQKQDGILYYWTDAKQLRYCPRVKCWKGKHKHRLHGCYLVFDDIATILPADNWSRTPIWMRKMFAQARHFGIRILSNLQDPFSVDVNFRRYTDIAFRFRKIIGSRDPDETKPPVKRIWGIYHRRKIKAEWLWKFGDMPDDEIQAMKEKIKRQNKINGTALYKDIWRGSPHWISKAICSIYDTTQDVPEYQPTGYEHTELGCIDPRHNHEDKKAINYCGFKKVSHDLV